MAGAEFIEDQSEFESESLQGGDLDSLRRLTQEVNDNEKTVDAALINDFLALRRKIDAVKEGLSLLNKKYDSMQQALMNQMLLAAMKSIRTDSGALITVRVTPSFSASNEDKRRFAREFSREDLLTINSQTFDSAMRALKEAGESIPAYVTEYERKTLSVRGA